MGRSPGRTRRSTPGHGFPSAHCDCPEQSRLHRAIPRSEGPMPSTPREPRGPPKGCSSATAPSPPRWAATAKALGLERGDPHPVRVAVPLRRIVRHVVPHLVLRGSGGHPAPRGPALPPHVLLRPSSVSPFNYTGFSPSYLQLLLSSPQIGPAGRHWSLGVVALGGEASSIADIHALWAAAPQGGGVQPVRSHRDHHRRHPRLWSRRSRSPGGRCGWDDPTPGVTFHVVDESGQGVAEAANQVGELYIGGGPADGGVLGCAGAHG